MFTSTKSSDCTILRTIFLILERLLVFMSILIIQRRDNMYLLLAWFKSIIDFVVVIILLAIILFAFYKVLKYIIIDIIKHL